MLQQEFEYYRAHQEELVKKYNGKFIVIKGDSVIGVYESHADAYRQSAESNEVGTFLIQHCLPGVESYTQTFHSRVIVNNVRA